MDRKNKIEIEADVFQKLVKHFRKKNKVQNIELMNLAGFCRNCLSNWYREEAEKKGINISDPEARKHVYGMKYEEWKKKYKKK